MYKYILIIIIIVALSCKDKSEHSIKTTKDTLAENAKQILADLQKDSNNIELQINAAKKLDSSANYKEAIKLYYKLIAKDNANQDYWIEIGRLHAKNLDTVNAIKSFVVATKIYPKPIAMLELANLFAETKNINTIKVCEDLMKIYPDGKYNAQANYFIARFYTNTKNYTKSLAYLEKSIADNFHFTDAYIEKGYILYSQNNYSAALKNFELLNTFNQANADGYYWQAKCNEALNKKQAAIELYKQALKFDANIVEAQDALKRLGVN